MTPSKARTPPACSAARIVLLMSALAGCAGGPGFLGSVADTPPFRDPAISMPVAKDLIVVGQTTKAEAAAALGNAAIVKFDSGYEVWVYRAGSREPPQSKAEFVILFTPSGVVKKTRIRPAYPMRPT